MASEPQHAATKRVSPAPGPNGRYAFVDDLRGIAAMAVAVGHLAYHLPQPARFLEIGRVGVEIFFVISGFVMAYTLERERITGRFGAQFMIRRSIRLDPPYWVAIVLQLFVARWLWEAPLPSLRVLALNVVYLQDLAEVDGIISIAWTLCLELQFYLVFCGLLWVVQRLPLRRWAARGIVFGPVAIVGVLVSHGEWGLPIITELGNIGGLFINGWYLFFLGVLAKWVLFDGLPLWVGAILPGFALAVVVSTGESFAPYANYSVAAGVGSAAALAVVGRTAAIGNGLRVGWISYLGRISYSLYLTHWVVGVNFADRVAEQYGTAGRYSAPAMIIGLALSVISADILYRAVEAPSVRLAGRAKNWRLLRTP